MLIGDPEVFFDTNLCGPYFVNIYSVTSFGVVVGELVKIEVPSEQTPISKRNLQNARNIGLKPGYESDGCFCR